MQQPEINAHNKKEYPPMHTAEHLLNGLISRTYECGRAFSAHVEKKKSKLDYHMSRPLSEEEILNLENSINRIIEENVPVTIEFLSKEEAGKELDLSRLPEDASQTVRVVRIGQYDSCLCAGDHVANTSEIGKLRISSTRYADGVQRLVFRLD